MHLQMLDTDSLIPPFVIVIDTLKVYGISRKVVKSLSIMCQVHAAKIILDNVLDKSIFILFNNFRIVLLCTNITNTITSTIKCQVYTVYEKNFISVLNASVLILFILCISRISVCFIRCVINMFEPK